MTPDELAEALRRSHPDAEPFELDTATVAEWVADLGADPDDDGLVSHAMVAWERLLA